MTLSNAGPGGIPFLAGDDAETAMLDGDSSITTYGQECVFRLGLGGDGMVCGLR